MKPETRAVLVGLVITAVAFAAIFYIARPS
jgi:hypothetical protein